MALSFNLWSRTAASNATADPAINWAEGQAPSSVNDSARAMMASLAGYRDDVAGAITTGGSATAYTVTSYQVFSTLAAMAGQMIAFVPHATNTNAVGVDMTLNVDGLGAKSIRMRPSVKLPNGTLILGTPYVVTYNNSDAVFYLQNMNNPYQIPLGAGMDFWGTTAPNTSFAFPAGQQISQTTYATLYALFGANAYGADGGGLFYLPDKTGRVSAMKEASETRLTTAVSGLNGGTMGAALSTQTTTLASSQLPPHAHTGTTDTIDRSLSHTHTYTAPSITNATASGVTAPGGTLFATSSTGTTSAPTAAASDANLAHLHTFTTGNGPGSSVGVPVVQPTIICQYILRII